MAAAIGIILDSSSVIVVGCVFCLAYVELYGRNSTKGNVAIFPLSHGIYPAGGGIYPKHKEISIELKTVLAHVVNITEHELANFGNSKNIGEL